MIYQMLRIFDGGCPGSRTWDGEANHTVSSFCTCKIKNFCFAFMRIHYSFLNCKKIFFFLRQSNKKSRGYKPRLIIRNVLYTESMNSLLNIKNRVISYALSVTHGRCLFCFVGISIIFRIIFVKIIALYFFYKYWSTSLMASRNISWSKLFLYHVGYCFLFP